MARGSIADPAVPALIRALGRRSSPLPHPYQQGQLDSLCGLYSAVNAAVLLASRIAPLKQEEVEELFYDGIRTVEAGGELASTVPLGVDLRVWRRLVEPLARSAARRRGYHITVCRPFRGNEDITLAAVHCRLTTVLDGGGVAALMLCGAHHHYTVIAGHSGSRYRLFDSSGLRWLGKAACGLPGSDARHRLATGTILLLQPA